MSRFNCRAFPARLLNRLCAAMLAVLLFGVGAANADAPQVQRDAAIAAWLADDELTGLQGLSDLAHGGDASAQVLLGLIDRHAALQGPALLALPRAERLALLRAPGGLSGRNWLTAAAAQGNELAIAWHDLGVLRADLDTAAQLAAMGETRALAQVLLTLAKRQDRGFDPDVLALDWYPDSVLFLSRSLTLSTKQAASLHPGDPQRRYLDGISPASADLADWLARAPAALHLRAACAVVCPSEQGQCVQALYHALGGYQVLLTHGSPANAIIPDATLADSPRGRAALARRIMLMRSTRMREAERLKLAEVNACAAEWLSVNYDAYSLRKIPAPE